MDIPRLAFSYHDTLVPLPHCPVPHSFAASLLHSLTAPLSHWSIASPYPNYSTSLFNCFTAPLSLCFFSTDSLPQSSITSQPINTTTSLLTSKFLIDIFMHLDIRKQNFHGSVKIFAKWNKFRFFCSVNQAEILQSGRQNCYVWTG
jgi:hypothetical protein